MSRSSHTSRHYLTPSFSDDNSTLVTDYSSTSRKSRRPLSLASRIKLEASMKLPVIPDENNTYNYQVIVTHEGKYYPAFPGSILTADIKPYCTRVTAARLQQPLLGTALWAKSRLFDMYGGLKVVLESTYGCNLHDTVPSIWGYYEEITMDTTLNDVCAKYFKEVNGRVRRDPLVLGFRPRQWAEEEIWTEADFV